MTESDRVKGLERAEEVVKGFALLFILLWH